MNLIQKQIPQTTTNQESAPLSSSRLPVSFRGMKNNFTFENVYGTLSSDKAFEESTKKTLQRTGSGASNHYLSNSNSYQHLQQSQQSSNSSQRRWQVMEPPKVIAIDEENASLIMDNSRAPNNPQFDLGSFAIEDINLAQIP